MARVRSLLEHTDQRTEIALVPIAGVAAEAGSPFAVEHHQFCEPGRFAETSGFLCWRHRDPGPGPINLSDRSA